MYGVEDIQPVIRSQRELDDAHPIYRSFTQGRIGQSFSQDHVREKVIPAYMGLIAQCDDQMGRLFNHLEATDQMDNTMIILTSDHGDYLGDHWLGEKDLFHAPSVKVPLIIYDPRARADATRGTTCDFVVESIDATATMIEAAGREVPDHIVEGRSLQPFLDGASNPASRRYAISEYDYSCHSVGTALRVSPKDARLFMVATQDWKLVHCEGGFRPMLFDLKNDPNELFDLGADPDYSDVRSELYMHLHDWSRRVSQRVTMSDDDIYARRRGGNRTGVLLGIYDENEIDPELTAAYRGKVPPGPN